MVNTEYAGSNPDNEMNRPAMVAGGFYPKDPAELARMVDGFLSHAKPPALPGEPLGILVPHAGYAYSGSVAAHGYKTIGKKVKTVILLGVAHRVPVQGAAVWSHGAFETPLGRIPVNEALSKKIMAASSLIRADTKPHENEHSIEVQLPFLQRTLGEFSIVPLLLNNDRDLEALREIGHAIAEGTRGESVLLVLSSDLSHYPTSDLATLVKNEKSRISLQNGTGQPGLATRTAEYFKAQGLNVIEQATAGQSQVTSSLIIYTGKPYTIKYLSNLLKIPESQITNKFNPDSPVDIEIVLGSDWGKRNPMP